MTAVTAPRPPLLRVLARVSLTLGVIALSGAAVLGGQALIGRDSASVPAMAAPGVPVRVIGVDPVPGYGVTRRFTGRIEAPARADLGFERAGRVVQVTVDEGDLVTTGQVLALLDTADLGPERRALQADLAAQAADAELARLTLDRNDALTGLGHRSAAAQDAARLALARAEAGMAATRARIDLIDVRLDKSALRAPFEARIGARHADPGQTVAAGQAVLGLHAVRAPRLRVGLPPDLAATLAPGDPVRVALGAGTVAAVVGRIRPDLDPATQSRAVVIDLPPGVTALGDTADLILDQHVPEPGFWAPLGALREGARGSWSVMALEGDRAVPAAVEVIHTDGARVFLRGGLPPGARIVAEAPDRVAPGQTVRQVD